MVHRGLLSDSGDITHRRDQSGQERSGTGTIVRLVASADRLLELLALLSSRTHWTADELADRLEVTERTVRRDVARLREIGYAVESGRGLHGGYQLTAGSRLPPLVLDDDEAMVIAVSLAAVAANGGRGTGEAALKALAKLDRILPPRLRDRAKALHSVTLGLTATRLPAADPDVLIGLALTCDRPERIRFDYLDAREQVTRRHVEPFRLVFTSLRWYLVAYDLDRVDWRTFRVDRLSELRSTGIPFERGEVPDAARQVATGVSVAAYDHVATVRFGRPRAEVERMVHPTVGVILDDDDDDDAGDDDGDDPGDGVVVRIGGDPDWIAHYLIGLPGPYEVVDSPQVVDELRRIAHDVLELHAGS
jgi:predicted DNA-binding transcriptional regulator YafY